MIAKTGARGTTTATPWSELEAANEKNRAGSALPLRADLRAWTAEKKRAPADRSFTVPAGLRRILDRDMKAAGIPKRADRNRTVDVHAMRTTIGAAVRDGHSRRARHKPRCGTPTSNSRWGNFWHLVVRAYRDATVRAPRRQRAKTLEM